MIAKFYMSLICSLAIFVRPGQPLKCWSCSSILEPGCDDPFNPEDFSTGTKYFLLDCDFIAGFGIRNGSLVDQELMDRILGPNAKEHCRKVVRTIYGMTIVNRGCAFGDISKDCSASEHDDCSSEACFEDGCNGATRLFSLPFSLLLMLSSLCHLVQ